MRVLLLICLVAGIFRGSNPGSIRASIRPSRQLEAPPHFASPTSSPTNGKIPQRFPFPNRRNALNPFMTLRDFKNGTFVDWYAKFFDKIIEKLDEWTKRTETPTQVDLDRVACLNGFRVFGRNLGSPWTIKMIDSASKLQAGLLLGNTKDLGQYDECVRTRVSANESDPFSAGFTGRYCLVSFNIHLPGNSITLDGKNTKLVELFGTDWIPLTMGHCYPSLCQPYVLEEALNAVLSVPDEALDLFGLDYGVNVSIAETDCYVKDQEPYDALDWTVAFLLIAFLFVAVFCTTVDYFHVSKVTLNRQIKPLEEVLVAFSLYTNGRKLLDTRYPPDAMVALNGLKVFSIAWVVLGHRYRYLINQPLVNLLDFPNELEKWSKMILLSGPLSVDTFFLISGLLNMYTFAIIREKKRFTPFETLIQYIHRYLRLTPAYLVMIGVTATWLYRTGDGPYWGRMVGSAKDFCRTSYWQNLIYLNNYLNPDNYCMMQSWYLAADMQMFWLSPFLIYPLWRWPIFGFIEVALLTVASILSPLLISYFFQIRAPIPITTDPFKASHEMAYLYLPTHTKSVSYVVGILAGYLLYNFKRGKIKFQPNKVTLAFFWLASTTFMLFAVFGSYTLYQRDDNYNRIYSAFYIGFFRFFWAIGVVWITIACITGYGGPVNTLLSWAPLGPIARLTYCIYLTHVAVILRGTAGQRLPVYFSDYNQIELYLGDLAISIGAAVILSLFIEAPMMKIEKLLLERGFRKNTRPRASSPSDSHNHSA